MFVQLSNLDFRILSKRSTAQDVNGPYKNTAQLSRIQFRSGFFARTDFHFSSAEVPSKASADLISFCT